MGGKIKPKQLKKDKLTVNLPNYVIEVLSKAGPKTTVASDIILQNYQEYIKNLKK